MGQGRSPKTGCSPTTQKELQSFLGLASYYRYFVPRLATKAPHLTDLLKGKRKGTKRIVLSNRALHAFNDLKHALFHRPVLHTHTPLEGQPFLLHMDDSNVGIVVVLGQETPQGERPIFYLSWKLMSMETKYAVIEEAMVLPQGPGIRGGH